MNKGIDNDFRIAADIGGTFTDVVFMNREGVTHTKKLLSTPDDYTQAIVDSIQEVFRDIGLSGTNISQILHGCTIATNAILEHTGARTGLITTKGFRDILEIRRFRMPEIYNVRWDKPPPLSPREWRLEVNERIDYAGKVIHPLDLKEVEEVIDQLVTKGIESLAVCLLHSYANPIHEQKIKEIVQKKYPNLTVSISSELIPVIKEYERTSETVVNTYVKPAVVKYMQNLEGTLQNIKGKGSLLIMQSGGGLMSVKAAMEKPVYIIESGPAAGVVGSAYLSKFLKIPNILTLDMGGTTTKSSIIENNEISLAPYYEVGAGISIASRLQSGGGYSIRVPSIDIAEIGAGGGSKLWLDKGMVLHVGPTSVGAKPGPACYDLGGAEPSLTDANLILGYLNPKEIGGGRIKLNKENSFKAVREQIAAPMKISTEEAAYGAHIIANSNMTRAISAVSTTRGRDPRNFVLFAFGGAGPMHAVALAKEMEIKRVIIPPFPGLFSAFGLLFATIEYHFVETLPYQRFDESQVELVNKIWDEMKRKALTEVEAGDYGDIEVDFKKIMEMRYVGQSSELMIPVPWENLKPEHIPLLREAFNEEHFRTYGHKRADEPVELVNARLIVKLSNVNISPEQIKTEQKIKATKKKEKRKAYFGKEFGWMDTTILGIDDLLENAVKGPVIVELNDSTCVVPPYAKVFQGPWGSIIIDIESIGGEE